MGSVLETNKQKTQAEKVLHVFVFLILNHFYHFIVIAIIGYWAKHFYTLSHLILRKSWEIEITSPFYKHGNWCPRGKVTPKFKDTVLGRAWIYPHTCLAPTQSLNFMATIIHLEAICHVLILKHANIIKSNESSPTVKAKYNGPILSLLPEAYRNHYNPDPQAWSLVLRENVFIHEEVLVMGGTLNPNSEALLPSQSCRTGQCNWLD